MSYKLYTSIKDLPFDRYKSLTIDGDITVLVIEGEVPGDTLLETKTRIVEEFNERMTDDYAGMVDAFETIEKQNIDLHRLKITFIDFCANPTTGHVEIFKSAGIVYDIENANAYKSYVANEIISRENNMHVTKQRFEGKYSSDQSVEINHEYYDAILSAVSDMKGREIDDSISTLRFTTYYKELIRYTEKMRMRHGSRST